MKRIRERTEAFLAAYRTAVPGFPGWPEIMWPVESKPRRPWIGRGTAMGQDDSEFLHRFGNRLRAMRERQHVTVDELADQVGMLPDYLSAIEDGREDITLLELHRLANALDAGPQSFFMDLV